ncbi:hypothetical protein ACO0LC_10780 [Undibacterium sp. JH2W]|uniref:hypothetical protein n=1 Tax=Undibacterium sp. JH2W TaxID=3413037 RepID=UPI003BF373E6
MNNDDNEYGQVATMLAENTDEESAQIAFLADFEKNRQVKAQGATTEFLKWAASGVVGKVAGEVIGGPILDLFGLGEKDYTKYLENIQSQLADMRSEINQQMGAVQQGISEIKAAVTAISIDTKDQKLQLALQMYTPNKNKINQNFISFANAIAGCASKDTTKSARSVKEIFDLLQITNMNSISEAMMNIHDGVYGSGQMTGIIDYQVDVCYGAVVKWASISKNLWPEYGLPPFDYEDYSKVMFEASPIMNRELNQVVLPNLKAMLTVQLQGLALLTRAWTGTAQESQLKLHIMNLTAQITKIKGLYAVMTATAKYDKFVQDTIVALAKPLQQEVYDQYVESLRGPDGNVGDGNLRYWRFSKPPFGKDWVGWGHPRHFIAGYRRPFHKAWQGEEPSMFDNYEQPCTSSCIIKLPINFGGMNQIIHIGTIFGQKAPKHFYTGIKATIHKSGTPMKTILDPRNTPIPYPHIYIQPASAEYAAFIKEMDKPPA